MSAICSPPRARTGNASALISSHRSKNYHGKLEFLEPTSDGQAAGYLTYNPVKSPYELYMEEEGIPVFRGIGVRDTRDLPMRDWKRLGVGGCFLHLKAPSTQLR